jgi:hypothetical protein
MKPKTWSNEDRAILKVIEKELNRLDDLALRLHTASGHFEEKAPEIFTPLKSILFNLQMDLVSPQASLEEILHPAKVARLEKRLEKECLEDEAWRKAHPKEAAEQDAKDAEFFQRFCDLFSDNTPGQERPTENIDRG